MPTDVTILNAPSLATLRKLTGSNTDGEMAKRLTKNAGIKRK
jgi:hypothetical protein